MLQWMSARSSKRTVSPLSPPLPQGSQLCCRVGPGDVGGAGTVARLAGHVDLRPGGRIGVGGGIVVLAQLGRVAFRAHEIPGLVDAGPVQRVAGPEVPVGVEMEPALPALIFGPRIPRDAERLHPAVRERDQVLLQGIDAERVADLVLAELAVRPVGGDEELAVALEEARGHAAMGEAGVIEVAKDGFEGRLLHRERVLRIAPRCHLALVAPAAGSAADERRRLATLRGDSVPRSVVGAISTVLAATSTPTTAAMACGKLRRTPLDGARSSAGRAYHSLFRREGRLPVVPHADHDPAALFRPRP